MPFFAMQKNKVSKHASFLVEATGQGIVEKLLAGARLHIEDFMLVYFVFKRDGYQALTKAVKVPLS